MRRARCSPWKKSGVAARQRGIIFHTDAVQAFGKITLGMVFDYADMVTVTAHKAYGPRGAGALLVRRGTPLAPIMTGGHHEQGLRPGTENTAAIAGFAAAAEQAVAKLATEAAASAAFATALKSAAADHTHVSINSRGAPRVPNTSSVCFAGVESESVLLHLDLLGICASAGSACTTGSPSPRMCCGPWAFQACRPRVRFVFLWAAARRRSTSMQQEQPLPASQKNCVRYQACDTPDHTL